MGIHITIQCVYRANVVAFLFRKSIVERGSDDPQKHKQQKQPLVDLNKDLGY